MPMVWTAQEIAEDLADKFGVYGPFPDGDHPDNCPCRICFVIEWTEKIRGAGDATLTARLEAAEEERDEAVYLLARTNAAITYPDEAAAAQGRWALPAAVAIDVISFLRKAQQRKGEG